jgi:hypothetical protein
VATALDRAVKPSRIGELSASTQAALQENVAADKAELDVVRTTAASTHDSAQLRQARKEIKKVRAVNYVLVVNVLRKTERLLARATPGSPPPWRSPRSSPTRSPWTPPPTRRRSAGCART